MTRDLGRLATTRFDVLVVGAGIYGLTVAWDAAQRGLSVAIIDREDFGAATSFNSLKTLHGGLRSLQRGSLPEMRDFIRERRALCRIAPHLIDPLPFLIPTYRHPLRSRLAMRAALAINDLVALDRNVGVDPALHLPGGRTLSRLGCLAAYPDLPPSGVTGGAQWFDAQMYNPDRLALAFLQSAVAAGGCAANYVEATGFLCEHDRIVGVLATDRAADGGGLEIRARVTVNATGPWARSLVDRVMAERRNPLVPRLSIAMNLVTDRPAPPSGLGGLVDGRFVFVVPWRGRAMYGTSHEPAAEGMTTARVDTGQVERFLWELNRAFPKAGLTLDDIRLVHRGLLPMASANGLEVRLAKHSQIRDHRADGIEGLISVVGVRYTTARGTAERAVDQAIRQLGVSAGHSRTATTPLRGGEMRDLRTFVSRAVDDRPAHVGEETLRRLVRSYGTQYTDVLALVTADPGLAAALGQACPVTRAEILHAARAEMAVTLGDAILRRTEAGSAGHPGRDALAAAADVMAREAGWNASRHQREVEAVDAFYRIG